MAQESVEQLQKSVEQLQKSVEQLQKTAQRMADKQEIENLMAKHDHYHAAIMHEEALEKLWATELPDIRFSINTAVFEGAEKLREWYVKSQETRRRKLDNAAGFLSYHCLTTGVIEVAEDGKTAMGVWLSPGMGTGVKEGKAFGEWVYQKYAADFVKLDGKWKIWHIHTYVDFNTPFDLSWTDNPHNFRGGEKPPPPHGCEPTRWVEDYEAYSLNRIPKLVPKPPEPYKTFDPKMAH